jgi:ribosome recycling factor
MTKTELTKKLDTALDFFKSELSQIRTGRASPALLEELEVEAYGSKMKIKELGTILVPEPQMLTVSPWDKSLLSDIDKAIRNSELKLNPVVADDVVRVPIPSLTEERRQEFAKLVTSKMEAVRQSIRNIRQDAMKSLEKQFDEKEISEDEKFTTKDEFEKIIRDYLSQVEDLGEEKKKALTEL